MRISIGSDHRGFALKEFLRKHDAIADKELEWIDRGAFDDVRSDYPVFAKPVALDVQRGTTDAGILICGSGTGMDIAANRFKGIYAGLAWNTESARVSKEDDNINILVLPADFVSKQQALDIVRAWLNAKFKEDRYARRLNMIDE